MFLLVNNMKILLKFLLFLGFDRYLRNLRPKVRKALCTAPLPAPNLVRNCRNVWFKEFWTHHFNCTFREIRPPTRKSCTGFEDLQTDQEGLVPFVG